VFEQYLGRQYTILSFDLPHHGKSDWRENIRFTASDFAPMLNLLKTTYGVNKVSLMGYSIGGRVCLSMIAAAPQSIDKVLLMGTDGLKINNFYYFFTRTSPGKWIFAKMLGNPGLAFRLAKKLQKLKVISETQYKLVTRSLQTPEKCRLLLRVWPCLCTLVHRTATLRAVVKTHKIPISIFMGAFDTLLPPMLAERFAGGLDTVKVFIPQKGHRIFDAENAQQIAQQLL
jgi:pimeloyl-ACP methyl ester carboxylesterase